MIELKETYLSARKFEYSAIVISLVLLLSLTISNVYWHDFFGLSKYLAANKYFVFEKSQYYRIFLSVLIHADLTHFLSNSFMLSIFGILIHRYFGFLLFPVLTFFSSSLSHLVSLYTYSNEQVFLVGASGWIFLLGGCWLTLYVFIERKMNFWPRVFKAFGVGLILFSPQTLVQEVSYRTHGIGFLFGILTGTLFYICFKNKIRSFEVYEEIIEEEEEEEFPE